MAKKTISRSTISIMEIFVDPLFGAFGAFLFIFLMTILMIGVQIIPSDPVIVTKKLPPAYNGVEYRFALSAKGGLGDYHWSIDEGFTLPEGLELMEDGVLVGRPSKKAAKGTSTTVKVRVRVEPAKIYDLKPGFRDLDLILYNKIPTEFFVIPPVEVLCKGDLPKARLKENYNVVLAAQGGIPPYKWRLEAGKISDGMKLTKAGQLTGVPTLEGDFSFTLSVKDARASGTKGASDTQVFKLSVERLPSPPLPLAVVTKKLPIGYRGQEYLMNLSAVGGTQPYRWANLEALPEGLILNALTGELSGRPRVKKDRNVSFSVTDSLGEVVNSSPMKFLIVEGKLVPWWKILGILLLFFGYQFLVRMLGQFVNKKSAIIRRQHGLVIQIQPDGRVSATGPQTGINKLNTLTKRQKQTKWVLLGLAASAGIEFFFVAAKDILVVWPLVLSGIVLLVLLVSLGRMIAT